MTRAPADCRDMSELRAEIDRLDEKLVTLLAERASYIKRAVDIKQQNGLPAYIPERIEQVVKNVKDNAVSKNLDVALVEDVWRKLIDWSCQYEKEKLGR